MNNGKFIISLDFELYWGVRDKETIDSYGANIRGVHQMLPKLLELFHIYHIKATFSTVGFLFFDNKDGLIKNLPNEKPTYKEQHLSPYNDNFKSVGENEKLDPYHFGTKLIRNIQNYPEQEIGTHTFSHYYCLEPGQTSLAFKADLVAAQNIANNYGLKLTSLIFPRNQFNNEYLQICKENGIICYRGNEKSWLYQARNIMQETLFRRAMRIIDAYINISGHNCYSDNEMRGDYLINIPSSRFLRPYSHRLRSLDILRLNRIKSGMTYAAENNLTYHLWWHPHNFGVNQTENFKFLSKILDHYIYLNSKFNFQSYTMSELAVMISNGK